LKFGLGLKEKIGMGIGFGTQSFLNPYKVIPTRYRRAATFTEDHFLFHGMVQLIRSLDGSGGSKIGRQLNSFIGYTVFLTLAAMHTGAIINRQLSRVMFGIVNYRDGIAGAYLSTCATSHTVLFMIPWDAPIMGVHIWSAHWKGTGIGSGEKGSESLFYFTNFGQNHINLL
jgi:hypothetical protein